MARLVEINIIHLIQKLNQSLYQTVANEKEEDIVSELQMHKILYIIYGGFYAKFAKELFANAQFEAWKYGPVEIDYRQFHQQKTSAVPAKFIVSLSPEELKYLQKHITNTLQFSAWSLVEFTTSTKAWINNYDESANQRFVIPTAEIKESFE